MRFFRDTRHLWILAALLLLGGLGFVATRTRLVPASFGRQGPYRAEALAEISAKPSVLLADAVCHECHQKVHDERAESLHKAVRCVHCHGLGRDHVAEARLAKETPGRALEKAAPWDGDFLTSIDLYITRDKKTCLVCHEATIGMPKDFKKIDVAEHLEEQGASEPAGQESCFECHGGHNTAP